MLERQSKKFINQLKGKKALFWSILISASFWMLIKLSKDYDVQVDLEPTYGAVLDSAIVSNSKMEAQTFRLRGHGYGFLALYLKGRTFDLSKSFQNRRETEQGWVNAFVSPARIRSSVQSSLPEGLQVLAGFEDSIKLRYSPIRHRKLPIFLSREPECPEGSVVLSHRFIPDSVWVVAPLKILDTIKMVKVWNEELSVLASSIDQEFTFFPDNKELKLLNGKHRFTAEVSALASKSMKLNIQVLNGEGFKILPAFADVELVGPASLLSNWTSLDFKLIVQADTSKSMWPIKLQHNVLGLSRFSIKPEYVEYLLERND